MDNEHLIDTTVRQLKASSEEWDFVEAKLFAHKNNFWNNSDKFLVRLRAEQQPFMIGVAYNDTYHLPRLNHSKELLFVVCWQREIASLLGFFSQHIDLYG